MATDVFQRYELKYLFSAQQYEKIKAEVAAKLSPDAFGETTIQSLYLDTPDSRLIRASIEKPTFKEKLRLRCYGLNDCNKDIFLEMKRKYDGVVYKRRISCKEENVQNILSGHLPPTQIGRELHYFLRFYHNLSPKMLILYDRSAFFDPASELRITFDRNIRYRTEKLNFSTSLEGEKLLPNDAVLMEIKCGTAFPLWLCKLLSEENIKKESFSKYGAAYIKEFQKSLLIRSKPQCLNPSFPTEPLLQPAFLSFSSAH